MRSRRFTVIVSFAMIMIASGLAIASPFQATESRLDGGIRLVTLDAESAESAAFEVWVRAGRWMESDSQPGVARATAEVLMRSGTKIHGAADVVDKLCQDYGISVEIDIAGEFARFIVRCDQPKAVPFAHGLIAARLAVPLVGQPEFDAAIAELSGRGAGNSAFVSEAYRRAWGAQHPQGRPEVFDTLTWDDVVAFYAHYRPAQVVVAANGPRAALGPVARREYAAWTVTGEAPRRIAVSLKVQSGPTIALAPAEVGATPYAVLVRGINVAVLRDRGALELALAVADSNRGGGGSFLSHSFGTMGEICIPLSGDDLDAQIQRTLDAMIALGKSVDESTLEAARTQGPAGPNQDPLRRAIESAFGRGPGARSASAKEIQQLAAEWLDPGKFHLLISGPRDFVAKVSKYGVEVEVVADSEYPKPAAELLANVVKAFGGEGGLDSLETLSWRADRVVNQNGRAQAAKTRSIVKFPLHMYIETSSETSSQYTTVSDEQGWMVLERSGTPELEDERTVQAMPDSTVADFRLSLLLATTPLLRVHGQLEPTELAPTTIDGKELRVLRLDRPGVGQVDFYVEPDTHRIVRRKDTRATSRGLVMYEEVLEDFRKVGTFTLPHKRTIYQNGTESVRIVTERFTINPEVKPGTFDAPEGSTP